jgi:serine/threonine-protein kinase RsbW
MPEQDATRRIHLDERLESTLESVDHAESRVTALAGEAGIPEEETFRLGYAVREAMVNAVVHGNRYSANKRVHLVVGSVGGMFEVAIQDEGDGFRTETQPDPLAEENLLNQSGRGITIIRAFVDEFEVTPVAPAGTLAVLRKKLPQASETVE